MVVCELDKEVSGEILGLKLPEWQALLLHRVLPSCGGLVVYLTLMCFDFAVVYEHFRSGDEVLATFCIILMTWPAVIALVFTLASPPPSLQPDLSAYSISFEDKDILWVLRQCLRCLFFPVAAIGRYCYLIFWWIEAVCASFVKDRDRTHDAILRARSSSSMELYLFLQAFLHSAPLAILNILDIMARYNNPLYGKVEMQAVSVVVSCMRMASTATLYRRFEREKLNGRTYPWNNNNKHSIENNNNDNQNKTYDIEEEPIYEAIRQQPIEAQNSRILDNELRPNSDFIQFSPRTTQQEFINYDDIHTDSESSSDYFPPTSYADLSPGQSNSDDEYVRPISIIDRVAPRRTNTQITENYVIEKVEITPPPIIYAPRPGSIAVWAEKIMETAEDLPTWLSAPTRRKYNDEVVQDEPDIPRRVPRSKMRGLEPQDATAALVHYMGWYAFFVSRLLSIAALINLSVVAAVIVLFSHYQVMLLLLIVPQAPTVKRGFYFFLAFVYLFCLMEFKIRFRHVRVWHVFWIIVCTVETVLFTGIWAVLDNDLHIWWKNYVVQVIFISMLLSYMCFLVYFVILKPRETIVVISHKKEDFAK